MKVIHYIPSIDQTSGGVGSYMQLLSKELGKLVELHVVTHHSKNELQLENCHIHYISRCWWQPRKVKKQFIKIMNRLNPDVFHVNTCWYPIAAYTAIWNYKELHVPMVYSPHGMLEPWILKRNYWLKKLPALMLYQRKALRVANVLHATADSEKDNLLRLGYNKNVEVVANGIDVDGIDLKISWRRSRKILFLSRVHIKKGINYLIDAVSILKKEFADYTITIAGEGDDSYIDDLKRFDRLKKVYIETGKTKKEYEVEEVKYHKDMVLIKFKGIDKVEDAEMLRNSYLKVARKDESELEEGTYYIADLIGLNVYSDDGNLLGKVDDIFNNGGKCDIYAVKDKTGKQILLPAISDVIKEINLNDGKIVVHLIKGLI